VKLATIRTTTGTAAVRVDEETGSPSAVELGAPDLGVFLARPDWKAAAEHAEGQRHALAGVDYVTLVPRPEKVFCVGLNYRTHILEMGRELPEYPTLFAKFARSLVGAYEEIELPAGSQQVDWEAELGVVVGAEARHANREQATAVIAGYTVLNDVTARDFQNRSVQWLQGKTFERSTPVGPWLVTDTEPGEISCEVDGEVVQYADTGDLVFSPADLVSYISEVVTLVPGDIIATGTPGGVGHARTPPRYLAEGSSLVTRVDGVGEQHNTVVKGA
jgi:acylpyruvate hydrolase